MRKPAKATLVALGAGGALAIGVAAPAAYAAVTEQPRNAAVAGPTMDGQHRPGPRVGPGPELAEDLATRLGVSEEKVRTALEELRSEHKAGGDGRPGRPRPDAAEREQRADTFATDLAGKLGVDAEKVKQAMQAIAAEHKQERQAELKKRLDAAVADGKISRADADAYLRVVQSGVLAPGR